MDDAKHVINKNPVLLKAISIISKSPTLRDKLRTAPVDALKQSIKESSEYFQKQTTEGLNALDEHRYMQEQMQYLALERCSAADREKS